MPVSLINNNAAVRLELPASKASAEVYLFGATVTSWKSNGGSERLFLSKKAALDGSAAIRGGIPLVFPVFGAPSDHPDAPEALAHITKHGFARDNFWKLCGDAQHIDSDDQVATTLELRSADLAKVASSWPFDTLLRYTMLTVEHLASSKATTDMPFQALLHNYFAVPDSVKAAVMGLQGQTYIDKLKSFAEFEVQGSEVKTNGEAVDRAHRFKDSTAPPANVSLHYNAGLLDDPLGRMGKGVEVKRSAELRDTVVWNPAEDGERGIKDLSSGDWKRFLCVEPGSTTGFLWLPRGQKCQSDVGHHKQWQAEQTLEAW